MMHFCSFCQSEHEWEAPCKAMEEATARMEERSRERRIQEMTVEREWPPPKNVLSRFTAHGLECAVAMGYTLCGYVRVPPGHPCADQHYDAVEVDVHGGLTFRCKAIGGGAWFGFDTGHAGDWIPMPPVVGDVPGKIWDAEDVQKETEELARQLAAIGGAT
jgi:hypothetical protein